MNDKELAQILGRCLDQLAAGKTVAACLAQYPEHASELAPLLAMADELSALRDYHLSQAARQQARARLLRAEVTRNSQRKASWRGGSFVVSRLAAGFMIALFCVALSAALVAASQPGDAAYPLRALVERAPVLLETTAQAKTMTELRIADRRLADLETHLAAKGELAPAAIEALLAGDRAAAGRADGLPPAERSQAAERVAAHAAALTTLAQSVRQPSAGLALQAAAAEAEALAQRLKRGGEAEGAAPGTEAAPTETPAAPGLVAPPTAVTPTVTPLPTDRQPTHTGEMPSATPMPGRRATALAQTATAPVSTPGSPTPRATAPAQTVTPGPVPTGTPAPSPVHTATRRPDTPVPGQRATALAQTATPGPVPTDTPAPSPVHTATRRPDTPVPGRRATALAQTATPAPSPAETPVASPAHTPAGGSATLAPGHRATVLAQTATPAPAGTPDSGPGGTPQSP